MTVRRYHCVGCYYRALEDSFKFGDPDAFEDGEIEEQTVEKEVRDDEKH